MIAILAVTAVSVLWIGTTHRDRCMRAGDVGCSILPWSGHPAPKKKASGFLLPGGSLWGQQ